jgi:hypothetical protein
MRGRRPRNRRSLWRSWRVSTVITGCYCQLGHMGCIMRQGLQPRRKGAQPRQPCRKGVPEGVGPWTAGSPTSHWQQSSSFSTCPLHIYSEMAGCLLVLQQHSNCILCQQHQRLIQNCCAEQQFSTAVSLYAILCICKTLLIDLPNEICGGQVCKKVNFLQFSGIETQEKNALT